jgi:hypothetical protein
MLNDELRGEEKLIMDFMFQEVQQRQEVYLHTLSAFFVRITLRG